jgi:hypothetical protein
MEDLAQIEENINTEALRLTNEYFDAKTDSD